MALRRTISPNLSNRQSPPVTRSSSRLGQRHPFVDTSTPVTRHSLHPGMLNNTIERVYETADDSELDSSKFIYQEHFTITEITSMKKEMWSDWLEYRFRMLKRRFTPTKKGILNTMYFLVLFAMLAKYAQDSLQDYYKPPVRVIQTVKADDSWKEEVKKTNELISDLRTSHENLNNQLKKLGIRVNDWENEMRKCDGLRESVIDEFAKINSIEIEIKEKINSLRKEFDEKNIPKVIPTEEEPVKDSVPSPSPSFHIQPHRSPFRHLKDVNVANSLIGASIDHSCSSHAVSAKEGIFYDVMSYFGSFQEGYVLLDRDILSPGEAWCTYDEKATLTIKLARYIRPTEVSYQHVRWHGIVPNHAPKKYDVVACLDPCCIESEPMVSNCEYKASDDGIDEQEQFCRVSLQNDLPVNHVQFRFRENHGNMRKTCAYLVRVYGELVRPPKKQFMDNGTTSHLESADAI